MQFCAMGNLFSSNRVETSDDSSEESNSGDSEKDSMEGEHCMDALETLRPTIRLSELLANITLEKLQEIEKDLDTYEKVSLIYLLYDTPAMALQYIQTLLENAKCNIPHSILTEWIKSGSDSVVMKNKLIESFCIIQNYEVLRKLGFDKNEVNTRFAPLHGDGLFVNVVRKYLYRVCEDFDARQTSMFIEFLRRDLREKMVECNLDSFDATYLEMHLLELEIAKYITCSDVRNISRIFKYMELDMLYDKFSRLTTPRDLEIDNRPLQSFTPLYDVRERKPPRQGTYVENETNGPVSENYDIDPDRPGILFIINNVNFYTEFRQEYQKFTRSDVKLETRHGSEADEKRLTETFETFGFEVKISHNLTHNVLIQRLEEVVREVTDESSLFVAIMSHGIEGEVFGANSVSIPIPKLQDIMCSSRHLRGRPKVLILQSCQGLKCQEQDDELECDGPSNVPTNPKTADMLVFYATVPGFGAIRHKKDGSWFIQAFCETMLENRTKHFQDICVHVQSAVVAKRWGQKVMVPELKTTLSKFLYLYLPK